MIKFSREKVLLPWNYQTKLDAANEIVMQVSNDAKKDFYMLY